MRLTFALIMALSLLFAGCGVRGPLEPPPGADTSVEAPGKECNQQRSTGTNTPRFGRRQDAGINAADHSSKKRTNWPNIQDRFLDAHPYFSKIM